jgi:hypothetical protein
MDLYAPCRHALRVALWLEAHGYVFRPTPAQLESMQRMPVGNLSLQEIHGVSNATQISGTVAERYLQSVSSGSHPGRDPDANANASSLGLYGFGALETVLHFASKRNPSGEGAARRIDVIVTSSTSSPLACILSFHSSKYDIHLYPFMLLVLIELLAIVMNFIAYDRACSLFPNATFIRNQCLTFGDTMTSTAIRDKIYPKYWKRGFKISALPLPLRPASPINPAKPNDFIDQETRIQFGDRFIGDKLMWSIPLEPPPFSDEDDRAKATLYSEALDICGFSLSTRLINPSQYAGFYQDSQGQWPHKSDDQFPVIKFYLLCSVALENNYVLPNRYYPRTQTFLVSQQNLTYHFLALHEGMTLEGMGAEIQQYVDSSSCNLQSLTTVTVGTRKCCES